MHRRSLRSWWRWSAMVSLLLAFAAVAVAADGVGPGAVRKQIESSMLVSGTIDIEPSGKVSALALDQQERLPKGVVGFVRNSVMQWKFEPGMRDGKPVPARTPMTLRLVAKRLEGGDDYQVEIRGADFTRYDSNDRSVVTGIQMKPPAYPEAAFSVGAAGDAYLVLKVGRDGRVVDAAVEQVNLRVVASEQQMQRLRDVLGKSALGAAHKWTFRPPSEGKDVDAPYWTVRVPVNYALSDTRRDASSSYGRWTSYVPGPRQRAPWITSQDAAGFSPDLLPAGGVYMADGTGPRLLTPLQPLQGG
ncbi:energy transducer TonB [Xanthomonas sp. 3498]|uniref:energy transducer TonB n=1 Tax=Xanthomonas sp. 3498 TaxID=2663863 RepID=UPI0018547264|nr:energy transducer TonB [Xanthomonas sp. 3498]MBB5875501.1 hypothetical protein [Xanthomonas sp. 3498]